MALLADQMRRDPSRPGKETLSPLSLIKLEAISERVGDTDLIILVIATCQVKGVNDLQEEKALVQEWSNAGRKVLVFVNRGSYPVPPGVINAWVNWRDRRVVYGSVEDTHFLQTEFTRVVMDLLPEDWLALGRLFPLFRQAIANQLINDTCLSNAAYSLSTGLAEIVPVLDIPLNVTDFIVLTKSQAFLVYKLGLALGLSTNWQNYVTEFSGILGAGFLWRQLARMLVGLIPVYGIVPKVGIAYAGTYVSGHTVLQWYLTGRHISKDQMRELFGQALANGRQVAQNLLKKVPRSRLSLPSMRTAPQPEGTTRDLPAGSSPRFRLFHRKPASLPAL